MTYRVRDFDKTNREDAEKLASLYNNMDDAWPGGFTRGVLETAETLMNRFAREQRLATLVVEKNGEFVGYSDLKNQPGLTDMAYIPLLGARLSHHGKGVGKMLLREHIRRATEAGFREVTLGTWAGNMKAVPLYKKVGFHWVPDTDVDMRNFIPTALTHPVGKKFFAGRDWYACHERDLEVAPDDVLWKGMKVYRNTFRDGEDFLALIFEAQSGGVTGIETPDYAVSCSVPTEEAAAGGTYPVVWEIVPGTKRSLDILLLTETEDGLTLAVQERLTVTEPTTITRDLRIAPDARPRRGGERERRLKTTLLIDGEPVTLETGVKVVRPVTIAYGGQGLFPGRQERIEVVLHNALETPVEGVLTLEPHPDLHCEEPSQAFTIPGRYNTRLTFAVTAQTSGVHETRLRFTAGEFQGERTVALRAFGSGSALASVDADYDESASLETPDLRVKLALRGGKIETYLPDGTPLSTLSWSELGPPFAGWSLRASVYPATITTNGDETTLVQTEMSQVLPGIRLERRTTLLAGGLVKVVHHITNTNDVETPVQLRLATDPHNEKFLVVPLECGLVREPLGVWGDFPDGDRDILDTGERLAENWTAVEGDGNVMGLLWEGDAAQEYRWWKLPKLTFDLGAVPANGLATTPAVYLAATRGDWHTVRDWWKRLVRPAGEKEVRPPEVKSVLEIRTEPSPALLLDTEQEITVQIVNRRGKALNGTLTVRGNGEIVSCSETVTLPEIKRDKAYQGTISVQASAVPMAENLSAELVQPEETRTFPLPVIRLGSRGSLSVTTAEDGRLVLENGWMTLRFAPEFLGSLTSLERDGVNHLYSAFPEARDFQWTRPWFGGAHPCIEWMGGLELTKETFTGEPFQRTGETGIVWTGVRTFCAPRHRDRRWLEVETQYLSVPDSNVVALVTRWTNKADGPQKVRGGVAAWCQVGGQRDNAVAHWERDGVKRHRRRSAYDAEIGHPRWAAVENPVTRDILLLVPQKNALEAHIEDWAAEGAHLGAYSSIALEPRETKELLTWLVLTDRPETRDAYAALANLERLP